MAPIQNHILVEDKIVSLSIKNVPDETLARLRSRAERSHRSLQQELLAIIEEAAFAESEFTVDDLVEYVGKLGLSTPDEATGWIRELRDDG
jgi:antitoxin FitA